MISSPAAAKLVLVTKSHLFKPTFPASKERMLGKQAIFFHQGDYHMKLRRLVLRAFTPESIKNIIPDIESIVVDSLSSWENRLINTFQEMKIFTFNVALLSIFGKDEVLYREDLKRCYYILEKGFEVAPKPNTFMPFGNGTHSCPGNELAKLEILVLIHHLTTKYRWSMRGPQNEIHYAPFALPQNGLPIKLFPRN
nr:abscisic acid 8'-hydroxylase 1-like [Tanacetum cinerariifolium]